MSEAKLSRSQLALMTAGLALGTFLVSLDFAIINVSLPNIASDLGATPAQGTWSITSFVAANAIALPLTGWLAARFGEVRLFTLSGILFVISSFLCGFSDSLAELVIWRIVQGVVSGPMLPLSQAILLHHYPDHQKGMAMAVVSITVTMAPSLGPIVGGAITDAWSWPWIFYINIPIGGLAAGMVWFSLRNHDTERVKTPIDLVGLVLVVIGIACLQIFLDKGQELDWFESRTIVILGLIALVSLTYLIWWELTDDHPVMDFSLFANRNFLVGTLATSIPMAAMFAGMVVFPLWLQTGMGYTPTWAGIVSASSGVFITLVTPFVGKNLGNLNFKYLLTVAFLFLWFGNHLASQANVHQTAWQLALPRFIMGAGFGMFIVPLLTIALSHLPQNRMASATGMFYFCRTLATSVGTSLGISIWERRESFHHSHLTETLRESELELLHGQPFGDPVAAEQTMEMANILVNQQAAMLGYNDIFLGISLMIPPLLLIAYAAKPPFIAAGGPRK